MPKTYLNYSEQISLIFIVLNHKIEWIVQLKPSFYPFICTQPKKSRMNIRTKKTSMLNVSWYDKDDLERSGEKDSNNLEEICTKVVNQITGGYTNNNNTLSLIHLRHTLKDCRCNFTLCIKMTMPDLQQYPWNLSLINNVEDIVVALGFKVLTLHSYLSFI